MQLRSIELVGFKSFADRTRLEFPPGITAIVGPNGCGKSNILDAMRWVLGEQRPRALRGARMEDVIFGGTERRKPLGMAEVSLTITDLDPSLGLEYEEVTITRRLFRSGESVYLLNKTPCRLRDIRNLFMDTGVGRSAYSVMEQGRIDQVLSSRPEDRREIFEEAAGVTRFKQQKKEALRKLEHTDQNLERLAAIIREVKRQIGSLQRQAGKARRYKALHDRLRILDLRLAWEQYLALERQRNEAQREIEEAGTACLGLRSRIDQAEARLSEARREAEEAEETVQEARRRLAAAEAEAEKARQTIGFCRERIRTIEERNRQNAGDLDAARDRLKSQEEELARIDEERAGLVERAEAADRELAEAETRLATLAAELREAEEALAEANRERLAAAEEAARVKNDAVRLEGSLAESSLRRERLRAEKTQAAERLERIGARVREFEEVIGESRRTVETRRDAVRDAEDRLRAFREEERAAARTAQEHEREAATILSRIDALEELADPGERSGQVVADPADLLGRSDPKAIVGRLLDGLRIDPSDAEAVEAVLGEAVHAWVLGDESIFADLAKNAWERGKGRLWLVGADLAPSGPGGGTGIGVALADRIDGEDPFVRIARALLHRWVLVPSLEEGQRLRGEHPELSAVTPRGEMITAAGLRRIGRSASAAPGPLAVRRRIEELRTRLEAERRLGDETRRRAAEAAARALETETVLARLREELRDAEVQLAAREGEMSALEADRKEQERRLETIEWELQKFLDEEKESEGRREELAARLKEAETRDAACAERIAAATRRLETIRAEQQRRDREVNQKRLDAVMARQELRNLDSRRDPLAAHVQDLRRILEERRRNIASFEEEKARLQEQLDLNESALSEAEKSFETLKAEIVRAEEEKGRLARGIAEIESALRDDRDALSAEQERKARAEVRQAEAAARIASVKERVGRDYQVVLEDPAVRDEVLEEAARILPPEPDWTQVESEVAELRERLVAMGPVNLVAIEEFEELQHRYEELCAQQEDMIKAARDLRNLIQKINNDTRKMFAETFEKVRVNFQKMFKELFAGGHANLLLVDEEDILESGIEIVARPPGKKPQNISLLSGGERTLTAVALLFAIYLVKPSPFCILDELDAALDDANIERYVEVLTRFSRTSQFLIITHSKQTIAAADVLYGITMEETGVSKVVSARLSGRRDARAAAAAAGDPGTRSAATRT